MPVDLCSLIDIMAQIMLLVLQRKKKSSHWISVFFLILVCYWLNINNALWPEIFPRIAVKLENKIMSNPNDLMSFPQNQGLPSLS